MLLFPILSDYKREVIRQWDLELHDFARLKDYTVAKRSVFVLDESGTEQYAWFSDNPAVEPDREELQNPT